MSKQAENRPVNGEPVKWSRAMAARVHIEVHPAIAEQAGWTSNKISFEIPAGSVQSTTRKDTKTGDMRDGFKSKSGARVEPGWTVGKDADGTRTFELNTDKRHVVIGGDGKSRIPTGVDNIMARLDFIQVSDILETTESTYFQIEE